MEKQKTLRILRMPDITDENKNTGNFDTKVISYEAFKLKQHQKQDNLLTLKNIEAAKKKISW